MRRESSYKFSSEDKKILEFRDEYGMTFSDIGRKLGISSGRANDRYRRLKILSEELETIEKYRNMDPNLVDDSEFIEFAFAHLSTLTFNALARLGVLRSKEKFMNISQTNIMNIRNIGTEGFIEIKKLMKIIDGSVNENEYGFKDEDIDPEILPIVKNFNDAGIKTIFSCQGHFKEDADGISIPYLMINYPKNDMLASLIFKRLNKYPMLRIVAGRDPDFELFDNIDHSEVSDYSKLLDKVIDETDDAKINISTNPIMYNIPEELNSSSRKEIFEYLRKRFLTELLHLSEELLKESIDIKTNRLYRDTLYI